MANQRDSIGDAIGMIAAKAQELVGESGEVSVEGPAPAPFSLGEFTPDLNGHIAKFYIGNGEVVEHPIIFQNRPRRRTCLIEPTPEGSAVVLPESFRNTWMIGWWEEQSYAVPYKFRNDVMRFPIGGDGTPGSGYTVRVYQDTRSGEIGVLLPKDPEAQRFIRFCEDLAGA